MEIIKSRQGMLRARATLAADGVLVIPGNTARGWKARVDGRPADVLRANLSSKGIVVPAGRHEIELEYWPRSFVIGSAVSILAILASVSLVFISAFKGNKPAGTGCLTTPVFL